jgi:hypothetical protein
MRAVILSTVVSFLLATSAQAAPSVCKGLDTSACAGNSACTWRPALEKGAMTKAGTPAVRGYKAHCRAKPVRQSPKPAKTGEAT